VDPPPSESEGERSGRSRGVVDPPPSASEGERMGKEPGAGSATVIDLPQDIRKHMDSPEGKWMAKTTPWFFT
jgi:hypothetical protein